MELKINKGQVVTSVCLAVAGWFAIETYSHAQRISALEEDKSIHARQDNELQEIRKSIQDITILFFQDEHDQSPAFDAIAPDDTFSAAQMVLKDLVRTHNQK
jgi:hypothetical protein